MIHIELRVKVEIMMIWKYSFIICVSAQVKIKMSNSNSVIVNLRIGKCHFCNIPKDQPIAKLSMNSYLKYSISKENVVLR